jgi:hypothetical protein
VKVTSTGGTTTLAAPVTGAQAACTADQVGAFEVLPDNAGGFLFTWETHHPEIQPACVPGVFVSRFASDGTFIRRDTLPLTAGLATGPGGGVLSENLLFVADAAKLVGLNLANGSIDLNWTCPTPTLCRIVSAAEGDKVADVPQLNVALWA